MSSMGYRNTSGRAGGGGGGRRGGGGREENRGNRGGSGHRGEGRGGGGGNRTTPLNWCPRINAALTPSATPIGGWMHEDLPDDPNQADVVKTLMPTKMGGTSTADTLSKDKRTFSCLTNHWQLGIKLPPALFRYEIRIRIEKPGSDAKKPDSGRNSGGGDKGKKNGKKSGGDGGGGGGGDPFVPQPNMDYDVQLKLMQVLVDNLRADWAKATKEPIGIATDFSRIVLATKKLHPTVSSEYAINHSVLPDEDGSNWIYHVSLFDAAVNIDLENAQVLIDQGTLDHLDLTELKQIYNIVFKNVGTADYVPLLGRSALMRRVETPTNENYLGQGMVNWTGVSLVCTLGSTPTPFLNVEVENSAYLAANTVMETLDAIVFNAADVGRWGDLDYDKVMAVLKGCKIRRTITSTDGTNRKMDSRLDGICGFGLDAGNPWYAADIMFARNGVNVSVAAYFEELGLPLSYPTAPVLKLGNACVPAEFCRIKQGQIIRKILSGDPQTKLLEFCTETPNVKGARVEAAVTTLLDLPNHQLLREFGVTFASDKMHKLAKTRVLPSPELCYGISNNGAGPAVANNNIQEGHLNPTDGVWDMWNSTAQFNQAKSVTAWKFVAVGLGPHNQLTQQSVEIFAKSMIKEGNKRGMSFPKALPTITEINLHGGNHNTKVGRLKTEFTKIKDAFSDNSGSLLICVVRDKQRQDQEYGQVKQAAEREGNADVLTQCIQYRNFLKANVSVIRNILLKINTKLGGINHIPLIPSHLHNINGMDIPTLIIGIDVTHPSLPIQGRPTGYPSFASATGSLDGTGMPFTMHIQAQIRMANRPIGAAEVVTGLDAIVRDMLRKYKAKTACAPRRIIVFRDGVGESQFVEILQKEMVKIREACAKLHADYKPCITFIAVQKRHKTRFFEDDEQGHATADNVPPGTVIDTDVVGSRDFYLLSQKGMLGTSTPTHYHVLWDDSNFTMHEIQTLAYSICYNYSKCNRSVSYPAPTYYAHWAALRAKELANGYNDWNGDTDQNLNASLNQLNANIRRSQICSTFPMHFI